MKKDRDQNPEETLRPEYDFTKGVRGKYSKKFSQGTNVVVLDPDVAELFKDSAAVNDALHLLGERARRQAKSRRK